MDAETDLMDEIRRHTRDRLIAAAQAYMRALQSTIVVGDSLADARHDHRQLYLCGLDLLDGRV